MKKLFLILLMVCSINVFSQRVPIDITTIFPVKDSMIYYSGVVVMSDSTKKEILYNRAKTSITSVLKSDKDIIQSQDTELGFIVSKGFIVKGHNMLINNPQVWFTFRMDIKDGKYKYVLTDVTYKFDISVSTGVAYASKANDSYDLPMEQWIGPKMKRGSIDRKDIEKYLRKVDVELKAVITSVNTKMQQKEESW